MLVLSRHIDSSVVIRVPGQSPIRVTVLNLLGNSRAKLGFEAAPEVAIYREEIDERMHSQETKSERHEHRQDSGVRNLEGHAASVQQHEAPPV